MNIVIAGAGAVGRHAAEVLAGDGHNVTIIELRAALLQGMENELDIRTLRADCTHAGIQREAGVSSCDLYIGATDNDVVNLLSAAVAKRLGAKRCIARVHHRAFVDNSTLDYASEFGIDNLICPEHATAGAIARALRNPGALAVDNFAGEKIEMQELHVNDDAPAIGVKLSDLKLPHGVRIATITRDDSSFIAGAEHAVRSEDVVTLIGEKSRFDVARKMLQPGKIKRKHVVVMGGTSMGVWLCRRLRHRHFAVRLFVNERERAEELAEKLSHVTVVESDPTEPSVFVEEHLRESDAFVAVTDDDEHNILAAAQAKSMGVQLAIAVTQRSTYSHLLKHVGIDRFFSPRTVAVREIQMLLEPGPVRVVASLEKTTANVYEVCAGNKAPGVGVPLKSVSMPGPCVIGAVMRGEEIRVPGGDYVVETGDCLLIIGGKSIQKKLHKTFVGR
jgi:trk/ktr system potassium uptake protein